MCTEAELTCCHYRHGLMVTNDDVGYVLLLCLCVFVFGCVRLVRACYCCGVIFVVWVWCSFCVGVAGLLYDGPVVCTAAVTRCGGTRMRATVGCWLAAGGWWLVAVVCCDGTDVGVVC